MISVEEATRIVLAEALGFGEETLPLAEAAGRVLAKPLHADRDFPSYARVSMDGIAIRHADYAAGARRFAIVGTQAAGAPPLVLARPGECLEVMTGAVMPQGADTVIPYEQVSIGGGQAQLGESFPQLGQNVHPQGFDRRRGDLLVPAGRALGPAEMGVAAAAGVVAPLVVRLPRAAVCFTGDELTPLESAPLPHQIRASNPYSVAAVLRPYGLWPRMMHLPDERSSLRAALRRHLHESELIILIGGISKGKFDLVPEALAALGVRLLFRGVAQKPGKPFAFGLDPAGVRIFALPGNPAAALMCALRYLAPWLRAGLGLPPFNAPPAKLSESMVYEKPAAYFLPARLRVDEQGRRWADPVSGKGAGDLAGLADADGFLELPAHARRYPAGEAFPFFAYRRLIE
jgi:molybdopterin molybdotransferase